MSTSRRVIQQADAISPAAGRTERGHQPNVVKDIEWIIIRLNQEAGMTVLLVEQTSPSSAASP